MTSTPSDRSTPPGTTQGTATGTPLTGPPGRPFALVTGASSGIGLELAGELAAEGYDLLVVAEDDMLAVAADGLRAQGADVLEVMADLRTAEGVARVWSAVTGSGRQLDVAALNAGVGLGGPFLDTDVETEARMIELNVTSTVRLAKLVLRRMVDRGEGRVLITSSIASTVPGTYQSVYNATKSFLQSFAQALQEELKGTSVTVTSLMPGPTDTNFFARAGMLDTAVGAGRKDDPAVVAAQAVKALLAGRAKLVAGSAMTRVTGVVTKVVPDSVKARVHRRLAAPGSAG